MINLGRVGNNALVVMILLGLGYMIFSGIKGGKTMEKIKSVMGWGLKK